jgi:hypothetical protein
MKLPCVWTASSGFSLVKSLVNLSISTAIKPSYRVNDTISITVGLVDRTQKIIPNAENKILAQIVPYDPSVSLFGNSNVKPIGGYARFTDLAVVGSVGLGKSFSIQFLGSSLGTLADVSIISPYFIISGGSPYSLDVNLNVISYSASEPDFQADLVVNDFYSNRATVADKSLANLSSISDFAADASGFLRMTGTVSSFSNGVAQFRPKISPSKAQTYRLRFSGLGLVADETFTLIPGMASAIKVNYIDPVLIAWEVFRLDAAAVDSVDNVLFELGKKESLFVAASTLQGIEVLSYNDAPGCTAQLFGGIATFKSCSVRNVDFKASSYPKKAKLLLSFCPVTLEPCPTPLSTNFMIDISPPVYNITAQVCISQSLCQTHYKQQSCPCTKGFGDLQVANENFFGTITAHVYDSIGRPIKGSQLFLSASLVSDIDCVSLFGETVQQLSGGSTSWTNIGPLLNGTCDPKMSVLNGLKLQISVSKAVANYDLYRLVTADIPLQLDFPSSYLRIESNPVDTVAGSVLFPPPRVGLYAIMFSYPCWTKSLVDCVQKVIKTVRYANIVISPVGYTSKFSNKDLLVGTTSVPIVDGYAEFADIFITQVGVYNISFTSYSDHNNISSINYANITIRVGNLKKVVFLQQPQSIYAFQPQSVSALLLDAYDNSLNCDLGQCPSSQNGYPSMVNSQGWPTLPSSDLTFKATSVPAGNCSTSPLIEFAAPSAIPDCLCQEGRTMETRAVRAIGTFCSFSATSIGQFVLQVSVGALNVISHPFVIYPGKPTSLIVRKLVSKTFIAGVAIFPPVTVEFLDRCNNLASVDDVILVAGVEVSCIGIDLAGTMVNVSSGNQAFFTDLRVRRVLSSPCHLLFQSLGLSGLSTAFTVRNAELSKLILVKQPESALRGKVFDPSPKVIGYDPFGNLIVSSSSPISIIALLLSGESEAASCSDTECNSTSFSGYCFKTFKWPSSWAIANSRCNAWGGFLASVTSTDENEFVALLAQGPAWIGLSRPLNDKSGWYWEDKVSPNPPDPGSNNTVYSNWNADSVNARGYCTAINVQDSSAWGILQCDLELPFVCKRPYIPASNKPKKDQSCSCKSLGGRTAELLVNGTATFQDLMVVGDSSGMFRLVFSSPSDNLIVSVTSIPFTVMARTVQLKVWRQPGSGAARQPLTVQPLIQLMDSFGNVVLSETLTCAAKLIGTTDYSLLGDVEVISNQGFCEYRELYINKTRNLGFVIEFSALKTLSVLSQPFYVSQEAVSLKAVSEISPTLEAGYSLSLQYVYMLNSKGAIMWHSCISQGAVSSSCLVMSCTDLITAKLIGSKRNNSLVGNTVAACKNGVAIFTDLSVIEAYGIFHLQFLSSYTFFNAKTANFTVLPGEYTSLVYIQQPAGIHAGESARGVVALVDKFMNRVSVSNVRLRVDLIDVTGNKYNSTSINMTKLDGSFSFEYQILISGFYKVQSSFQTNLSACLMTEQKNTSIEIEVKMLCTQRSQTLADSNVFQVSSAQPASIRISRNISSVTKAGLSFEVQPVCEVRDMFGNLLMDSYNVQPNITNGAGGCLCDFKKDSECTSSMASLSVQVCEGICPVLNSGEFGNVSSVGGVAEFQKLACTKASCIPECRSCGADNCKKPYRFSCTVFGGSCNPCTAYSNFFDVIPNDIYAVHSGPIQIAVAGSPQRGIQSAGFYRSKVPLPSGLLVSGASFSTNSLERYSPENIFLLPSQLIF